jgi:2-haloacid dehalogenase
LRATQHRPSPLASARWFPRPVVPLCAIKPLDAQPDKRFPSFFILSQEGERFATAWLVGNEAITYRLFVMPEHRFDAVLFDLLTALLDSWTLWNDVAGSEEEGRKWRAGYLRRTYKTGAYRPYERLVADAAVEAGLSPTLAAQLAASYDELKPWPEMREVLGALRRDRTALGVVTNCSEKLGAKAVACTGIEFDVVVTAERAGYYKPNPRPYLMALAELKLAADRCLFVAGSAYDLSGAGKLGLATYWHDRIGMTPPADAPQPIARHRSLYPLLGRVLG